MIFGSACSGIEAPSVAWHALGWRCAFFSEIEPFASEVLAHRWPGVENRGDLAGYRAWPHEPVDVLMGGTPCQSFSVAGLRKGLDDPRGNLALVFLGMADRLAPRWIVWENVPGILSSNGGRDFAAFLGAMVELGYGVAYRVLDAQFFGSPLSRRRVFVVAHAGSWQRAAAILFDADCLRGDYPASRTALEDAARTSEARAAGFGLFNAEGRDGATLTRSNLGKLLNNQTPLLVTYSPVGPGTVRRLTPVECERLQGFPEGYTAVPWRGRAAAACPDTLRYRALGNAQAVPVVRWLGERIDALERPGASPLVPA